jgi:L,D-peptidoglycan transpeptidase YkuD (ErfK/YbiS/YcfS/YnhG family)
MNRHLNMKKPYAAILAVLMIGVAVLWFYLRGPQIPSLFVTSIPSECSQVILVLSPDAESEQARLWLMERGLGRWISVLGPIPATIGHKGLAWGAGEHRVAMPAGFRVKYEGDQCSPAGVFRIPFAFGTSPASDAGWLKLPYTPLTPSIIGVDDPKSVHYNKVVDSTIVERDWDSNEAMIRHDRLYEWGAFVGHNPERVPGVGSCIFLHLWPAPSRGTAGCTAISAEDLRAVLAWLDAAKHPCIVQGLEEW